MPRINKNQLQISDASHYDAVSEYAGNVIGRRIVALRKKHRMSESDLCRELSLHGINISRAALWKWENGVAALGAYQFVAISIIFGIDSISLFTSTPHESQLNEQGLSKVEEYRSDLIASGLYAPELPSAKEPLPD